MTYPIRPISEDEWPAFSGLLSEAFNDTPNPVRNARFKANTEFDRTLAAFDGDLVVGTTAVHTFSMTVPGGPIPVAGVTAVGVLASHRRRGILASLMRRQLHDIRERGESVAVLYATEAAIYGRFGYGRAADSMFLRVPRHGSAFVRHAPQDPSLRLRVAKPAESRATYEELYSSVMAERPGLYARHAPMWDMLLSDEEADQSGSGPLRSMIVEDDGRVRGYALFRVKGGSTDHDVPDSETRLIELFAIDPAAYATLWRSVLDRDLTSRLHAWSRPVDDPVAHLLAEPRHLNAGWVDELWVRVVDVETALASRGYSAPVDLVVEIEDELCPWNAGRWRLTSDASGTTCKATEEAADVSMPVVALGSLYLGGGSLVSQLGAGLVREHTAGAVRSLDAAMTWSPRPWGGMVF